ncbi:MAG: hypothetical protein HY960_06675 [Ignavibacteriae bacterium]|nr:hypothetical protein [Ignavibacteriota bacterium]
MNTPSKKLISLDIFNICLTFFLGLFLLGCSSTTQLSSVWKSNEIQIDGNANDWSSYQTNIKDSPISLGLRNDDEFVYVCLKSPNPQFRRQLGGLGLTLWFESESGTRFGLNYPMGLMKIENPTSFPSEEARSREEWDKLSQESMNEYEIIGNDENDRHRFSIIEKNGFAMKIGEQDSTIVYEVKVPLKKTKATPYALEASLGSIVKVEIKSGTFGGMRPGRRMGEGRRGGQMPGDMEPPDGDMQQGRRRGGEFGRGPRGDRPQPLDFSFEFRLSTSESK